MAEPTTPVAAADALNFPELDVADVQQLIEAIRRGLPTERFDALQTVLGVSVAVLADVVSISPSTLATALA